MRIDNAQHDDFQGLFLRISVSTNNSRQMKFPHCSNLFLRLRQRSAFVLMTTLIHLCKLNASYKFTQRRIYAHHIFKLWHRRFSLHLHKMWSAYNNPCDRLLVLSDTYNI